MNQQIDSELELVRSVAQSDRTAFERLFHLYHDRIYKFSIRMLQDHPLAEEVDCDALYAVWNGASKFREQSAVSTWILGIAYRRSLKIYNKNARHTNRRDAASELDDMAESSPNADPETHTDNAMQISGLESAMSSLSTDHRAVMELVALGYSISEIASIVGCPENTVKTRTFHARRQLRTALQDKST